MKKITKRINIFVVTICMVFMGAVLVNAENVYSWGATIPVGASITQSKNCSYQYQRAGNIRTSNSSSNMKMTITKNGSVLKSSTSATKKGQWVWTSWANGGTGARTFEYKTTSGSTFVGSIQATDSPTQHA